MVAREGLLETLWRQLWQNTGVLMCFITSDRAVLVHITLLLPPPLHYCHWLQVPNQPPGTFK